MIDLDLQMRRGEFRLDARVQSDAAALALFGPSGSGKTTLLHAIAGLLRPDTGHVRLAGRELFDSQQHINLDARQRRLGLVFQDLRLFPHMDVRHNLCFGARHRGGMNTADLAQAVELLGLSALLNRTPDSLSGGEARRVAIGRALLARPTALLLDEPLSGLHRAARDEVLAHLCRLRSELRVPVIMVSHQVDEVLALASQIALIEDGRIHALIDRAQFDARHSADNAVT
ncbi:MAG: ATP-binding cassette domain-containing protein [Rhodanobacteraceae bacterium]